MKKLMSVILVVLLFTLTACSESQSGGDSSSPVSQGGELSFAPSDKQNEEQSDPDDTEETSETAETALKSLVVYFSWSGNTENVANAIKEQTDSDIFEIVPATPYSDDYDTVVDLAQQEQRDNARPEIADSIENFAEYDVVYVGFPNWWGDMPMILYTFFDSYDLSGKTIAPFCTSGGSGLSNTVNEMKELEPGATVTYGLHIGSSASSDPDDTVGKWLSEIGLAK